MFTQLSDRALWFDGDVQVPSSSISDFISIPGCAGKLFVESITPEIQQYNKIVLPSNKIRPNKETLNRLDFTWNIPSEYMRIDLLDYLIDQEVKTNTRRDDARFVRIAEEFKLYGVHKLHDFLRVLIFIINTLNNNNVVWGVGRGSSVSSYLLYLIGVHDVDSYEYDLDITDFLR